MHGTHQHNMPLRADTPQAVYKRPVQRLRMRGSIRIVIATPRNQTFRQYQQLRAARRSITRKSVNNLQIPFRLLRHRKLRNRDGQMTTIFA